MKIGDYLAWIDRHKGTAAFLGAFASVTAGATWWLAKGGAAAFIVSVTALSDPRVAQTLQGLPDHHLRMEEGMSEVQRGVRQLSDALESYRTLTEVVVDWAPEHSQRLTDAVGGCYPGEECQVFFRGRRTQAGAACTLRSARPRIILSTAEEFPVDFSPRFEPVNLSTEFETIPVWIEVPEFIPPGKAGLIVMTIYADCPFAAPGTIVTRETFKLVVEIKFKG